VTVQNHGLLARRQRLRTVSCQSADWKMRGAEHSHMMKIPFAETEVGGDLRTRRALNCCITSKSSFVQCHDAKSFLPGTRLMPFQFGFDHPRDVVISIRCRSGSRKLVKGFCGPNPICVSLLQPFRSPPATVPSLPDPQFLPATDSPQPNTEMIRDLLLPSESLPGAGLECGRHLRLY
jgi:hypothetical protein